MSLNRECLKQVIEDLERQRQIIDDALKSLLAVEQFLGVVRIPAETSAPPEAKHPKVMNSPPSSGFSCASHPDNDQFSQKGLCKLCQSERMKEYWQNRRKEKSGLTSHSIVKKVEDAGFPDESDYVFSKQQRCPKCGLLTRFRRLREAKPEDVWKCLGSGCGLKVANYRIAVDRDYEPEVSAPVPMLA